MSTFDENTEHEDRPEFDDNGEPIIYIEEDVIPDEFVSEYDGVIDLDVQDDSFYETVWGGDASSVATLAADDSTTGEEVTDPLEVEVEQDASDTVENDGILEQAEENYNEAVDILIDILTQALAQGEITEEMNASILDAQGTKTKNEQIIKEICNVQEDNSILKQLADIKANMVAASVDDIIDILTEGGTKPWLYKDSDDNVLVDSQSIPELTVLVNKLNLIASGGDDDAAEIQLTPEFINMVVQSAGSGNSVKSVATMYYLSTSKTELIGGTWIDTLPTATQQQGKYLWYKIVTTYMDSEKEPTESEPICLSGNDGVTYYTWIRYADDANGNGISNDPTGKKYIGFAYNKPTATESNTPSDYTWSKIQGEKGDTGIKGDTGADGTTYYTWIKYSDNPDGTVLYDIPKDSTMYIGIATNKTTATESTNKSDYTWSKFKGEQGVQGAPGDDGVGVEEIIIQYAKNTSTTTAPTSGWATSMPSYQEGYYLWYRTRIKYSNSSSYVYSTPVCDQSWKAAQEVYTQYKQLSDKFTWIVSGGTSQSSMTLSDKMYELISKNITLTAEHINLNGYVSNDEANWSIDIDGNMETKNMNVEGDLSADTISCNNLNSPKYPATLDGNLEIYVNSSTGNDDNEPNDDVRYKTLQGAIDAIPKFLNGKTVYITMETDSTEDVYIRGIVSGAVRIYMNGKTLYGTLRSYVCSCSISVYGGTRDSTEGATGIIHPNVGLSFGSRAVSVGFEASQYAALYKVKVFAPDTIPSDITNKDKVCVASQAGTGSVYCKNIQIVNAVIGFRSNNHGSMHVNSSSGVASKYGFQSATGGIISIANNNQCGGKTSSTNKGSGGQVWYDANGPTFATGNQTTDSGSAPVVSGTKTITIKSSYGDTYRSSVYNNWKKDGTVRQGDYGYGNCTGCWFFGSAFSELKGCTISKVQITITRQQGGSSVPVEHKLWMHGHTGRPNGAPTLTSGWSQTFRLATGNSTTVGITDSTVLNAISAGTCKGFALRHTYDSVHYSVCSGNVTVKITYTE